MTTFLLCVVSNVLFAGFLAIFAMALTRFWRSPHLAHALWLLVLIKLVTPPIVQLPLDRFLVTSDETSARKKLAGVTEPPTGLVSLDGYSSTVSPPANPLLPAVDDTQGLHRESGVWDSFLDTWRLWLLAAWAMGTTVFVGVALRRHMRLLPLIADSHPAGAALVQDATRLARQIGLRGCPLRITAAHVCPFVTPGIRSPMIVLPSRLLAQLNCDQVNAILAHELAHIRRHDHWVRVFETCVLSLNWWNPIAWWASRQLQRSEEECCDAWVIWALPEQRRVYGETLLRTVEYLTGQVAVATPTGTSFLSCQLESRIRMVMNRMVAQRMSRAALAVTLLLGAVILPFGVTRGLSAGPPAAPIGGDGKVDAPIRGSDDSTQQTFSFLMTGLKAERQKLHQGVFRARGLEKRKEPDGKGEFDGPVEVFAAFDFDKGHYRFDRESLAWQDLNAGGKLKAEVLSRKYFGTKELSAHYNSRFARLELHAPGVVNPKTLSSVKCGFFDVRCLGIYNFGQLFKNISLDEAVRQFQEYKPQSCVPEGDGLFRVDWSFGDAKRRSWWIDTKQGFTPIRVAWRRRESKAEDWGAPYQEHHVKWEPIGDIWVPVSYRVFYRHRMASRKTSDGPIRRYRDFSYHYSIRWESVNQPISETNFTSEGLDLPEETYITDVRF